jgi:hypothetical protein
MHLRSQKRPTSESLGRATELCPFCQIVGNCPGAKNASVDLPTGSLYLSIEQRQNITVPDRVGHKPSNRLTTKEHRCVEQSTNCVDGSRRYDPKHRPDPTSPAPRAHAKAVAFEARSERVLARVRNLSN